MSHQEIAVRGGPAHNRQPARIAQIAVDPMAIWCEHSTCQRSGRDEGGDGADQGSQEKARTQAGAGSFACTASRREPKDQGADHHGECRSARQAVIGQPFPFRLDVEIQGAPPRGLHKDLEQFYQASGTGEE